MFKNDVRRLEKALLLKNGVVGIRLFKTEEDFQKADLPVLKAQINFCYMVRRAVRGKHFKASAADFRCVNAVYALGLKKPDDHITSGEILAACGLYENAAVAKRVIDAMRYPAEQCCGVEIGPLRDMPQADCVIIIANAMQTMRIFQGYTYSFGPAENLLSMGNQAMCSDLVAKPLYNNDMNFSLFCRGARLFGQCGEGDLGVGMPAHMFHDVTEGVIKTLTPVETDQRKTEILAGLNSADELGEPVVLGENYVKTIAAYVKNLQD